MARRCGLTHDAIHRIWKTFGLQPHRAEVCRLSIDPFFIDKVRDVVGLYVAANNRQPQPFIWTAPADLILGKIARLCGDLA